MEGGKTKSIKHSLQIWSNCLNRKAHKKNNINDIGLRHYPMKLVSWNVKGLGRPRTSLLRRYFENIRQRSSCFRKQKDLQSINHASNPFGWQKQRLDLFPSSRIGWRSDDCLENIFIWNYSYGIRLILTSKEIFRSKIWFCGGYYAFSNGYWKGRMLDRTNNLGNLVEGAWCVGGDFNQILYKTERNGSTTSTA